MTYLLKKKAGANFFAEILRNTKGSAAELRANPQYVNPRAHKKLREAKYPLTLPFDLFAEEVRAAFQKSNLQRWELMEILRGSSPNNPTDGEIAAEYFGISVDASAPFDEKRLILVANATVAGQRAAWGESGLNWLAEIGNVKAFLQKTGLEYSELLALLDLKFTNPGGAISVSHLDPSCDLEKKVIQVLNPGRLDRIHRFLRMWRKLKNCKMWELDLVLSHPRIGNNALNEQFLIKLFYFSRLRDRLGGKTSVEQMCALFGDLNTETRFTKLHEKREDALYQKLFLNKRLINPIDPAFELDSGINDLRPIIDPSTGLPLLDSITGLPKLHQLLDAHPVIHPVTGLPSVVAVDHRPIVLAALGIREADLILFSDLRKASDGLPYITDELRLSHLSFLWRHAWLSKVLKFKAEEWRTILKLFQQDIHEFANPQAAWKFVEQVDHLKTAGLTPDELNWLLAADRSAKASTKETDAARFLTGLRKDLQAIKAEYDPNSPSYDFLTPPSNVDKLTALLTALLQKLNRDETETTLFLKTLRGPVLLEADVQGLGRGFTFPSAITAGSLHYPISYEWVLRFAGSMTLAQRTTLLNDPLLAPVTGLLSYRQAIQDLFEQAGQAGVTGLPAGFAFPAAITGGPNNIPIRCQTVLRFRGVMLDSQRTVLLDDTSPTWTVLHGTGQLEASAQGLLPAFTFPSNIPIQYDVPNQLFRFTGLMTDSQRATLLSDPLLAANSVYRNAIGDLYQKSLTALANYRAAIEVLYEQSAAAGDNFVSVEVTATVPGGVHLPGNRPSIPLRYDNTTQALTFVGVMTSVERIALLGMGYPGAALDGLFWLPRLAVKFFDRVFTAPLVLLPPAVDFKAQLPAELAAKVSHDAEQGLLRFAGIMSSAEKAALDALVPNALPVEKYHVAVSSLASQPLAIALTDSRVWLTDTELDITLPPSNSLAKRLATAARKALGYLSRTLSANAVIQQSSIQLGLTEALTRHVLSNYAVLPDPLLKHLTGVFASSSGAVNYLTAKSTFDGWYWAKRAAALLRKWKIALPDLKATIGLPAGAQLLDLIQLPLDDTASIAPMDRFLRTSRLFKLRNSLPETGITLFEVLEKLAAYPTVPNVTAVADFAADVERLNEAWPATEAEAIIGPSNPTFRTDYLLVETWERLRRAFYFLESLGAGAGTASSFAAAAMADTHAKTLNELLRSKLGAETWLTLSAEIQDVLRERKRDALAAYLLTQQPPNPPSGKWENTNDLYAYYLLDVEMCSCQLTSRLVQGSGSVQLFVQRCLMGLEPEVEVKADGATGDSAWRWWGWMRKYRIWEANRKVFLYPENWIAPEFKKDRSSFFKDLENELLQNELNQYTAETAFGNYLEKLDSVAQLEIAGFYQEDEGDDAILHVFGRTRGAEPHLYYYRRYDYWQWSNWEKVDLDIQGDYLIPAVLNKRLFLFWPVFTEVPDEARNSSVATPNANQQDAEIPKTAKKVRLQLAVSDLRQGKWSPKRISKDFKDSASFTADIIKQHYRFVALDQTAIDGRFGIVYAGVGAGMANDKSVLIAPLAGAFEIAGCDGAPATASFPVAFRDAIRPEAESAGNLTVFMKWNELANRVVYPEGPQDDFTLRMVTGNGAGGYSYVPVLMLTPGHYQMSPPWHLSYPDKLLLEGRWATGNANPEAAPPVGSWLPFFYKDSKRTFFTLPCLPRFHPSGQGIEYAYYPEVKRQIRAIEDFYERQYRLLADFSLSPPPFRQQEEASLARQFPDEPPPPYSDAQLKELLVRYNMRFGRNFAGQGALAMLQGAQFDFRNFYHPFVCDFIRLVENPFQGIPGLMRREVQLKNSGFRFKQTYQPTHRVVNPATENLYPKEIVDFSPGGAYSSYNWELFFHAPLLIANALSRNQRFEEARDWYHFIFNPIGVDSAMPGGSAMSKFWMLKPFFETTGAQYLQQRIDNLLGMLNGNAELESQVRDSRNHPFDPHRIANYRTVAYQKTVVMNYLDNLIAWGDFLFRQDSMESINEATQLYVLAAEILGPRPKKTPPRAKPPLLSFNELESDLDAFSNALVQVENLVPAMAGSGSGSGNAPPLPMLYFCIPQNDKMLGYWDTVADRLYKIRHCMNIEGVVRQLALFEPPIDPGALVKAVAGGADIGAALADLNAPLPFYRFNTLLQKANEVCNDVKALGGALLGALEKKDAEALSLLRQGQEIRVLEATKAVREKQIEEAKENLAGIKKSKVVTETRRNYYRDIVKIIPGEQLSLDKQATGFEHQKRAQQINITASKLGLLPSLTLGASGFGGSPLVTAAWGIGNIISALQAAAGAETQKSNAANFEAGRASTLAGYDRRFADWGLQKRLADRELDQLDRQIAGGELRVAIAEKELANHLIQIDNARATDEFMRSKYTNQELYQWQVGQISGVYFQSYKLAYDLAKRAERCFRFELGLQDSSYISFGYWDSLRKGLLSGEKLQYDLRRLETAYLEQNRRAFELTKHISLGLLDPLALVKLRETGRCFFQLPEEIFDLDYSGHYFRQIKSVSLTLPCVTGPYTTISCSLRLLKNSIRINTANGENGYPHNTDDQGLPSDDDRFVQSSIPFKAIAASSAQNDSGVFELNFRDERYLPFEGAGAISDWSLELFSDLPSNNPDPANPDFGKPLRQFDYGTISDAIVHVKYTSREDAGPFKNGAVAHLREGL